MTEPRYVGLQKEEINHFELSEGKVSVQMIAGDWDGNQGSFETLSPMFLSTITMANGGKFNKSIPVGENIFFYVVRGDVEILGEKIPFRNLVEFTNDGGKLSVEAFEDAFVIFGHAKPFNEPMVAQGPFVMNTQQEIMEAYRDYQQGKFGTWKH